MTAVAGATPRNGRLKEGYLPNVFLLGAAQSNYGGRWKLAWKELRRWWSLCVGGKASNLRIVFELKVSGMCEVAWRCNRDAFRDKVQSRPIITSTTCNYVQLNVLAIVLLPLSHPAATAHCDLTPVIYSKRNALKNVTLLISEFPQISIVSAVSLCDFVVSYQSGMWVNCMVLLLSR